MKYIIFAFAFLGTSFMAAQAQDISARDVPQAVASALNQEFPNATDLEWEMEGNNYEAEFDIDRTDHNVLIDPSGKVLMTKRDIMENDLPQAVRSAIGQNYKSMRLDDMERIEKDGKTYYQVELDQRGQEDKKIVFSEDGKEVNDPAYWD